MRGSVSFDLFWAAGKEKRRKEGKGRGRLARCSEFAIGKRGGGEWRYMKRDRVCHLIGRREKCTRKEQVMERSREREERRVVRGAVQRGEVQKGFAL